MSAYLMVQGTITDEAQFRTYRKAVIPFIATFGGKLVAGNAPVQVLEGDHDKRPVAMFEFPTLEAVHAFWTSPDYLAIKSLREGAATVNVWTFPGV